MHLIVDANRVFSALFSKSNAFAVFLLNNVVKEFDLVSPEFLFFEVGKHFDEILERSKLTSTDLSKVFRFIKSEIEFIPFKEFKVRIFNTDEAIDLLCSKLDTLAG